MKDRILVTQASLPPFEEYVEKIRPLWESHWITNMAKYHQELEKKLAEYLEVEHLSLFVNGHMALEMCIQAFDFSPGSEVITTPFTFISTTHAIVRNHLKPIFCDIKSEDYTMDENKIEDLITERTVAILPVHVYGNICNVEKIQEIADKYNLKVIYDAAHAFGEKRNGVGIGNFGDASIFSFHATKVFNSIEGGAVVFKDEQLSKKLYYLKNFGIKNEEIVSEVGANAKMNEFSAAMGLCNLEHLSENISNRKRIIEAYRRNLSEVKGIKLLEVNETIEQNYAYFPVFINKNQYGLTRNELYEVLKNENIFTRKYFYPITADHVCFKRKYSQVSLPIARETSENVLSLPLYADMEDDKVIEICTVIINANKRS